MQNGFREMENVEFIGSCRDFIDNVQSAFLFNAICETNGGLDG